VCSRGLSATTYDASESDPSVARQEGKSARPHTVKIPHRSNRRNFLTSLRI